MMFELRPYQRELIDRVQGAWADGFQAPCVVLPCGGGKSVIVAEIAKIILEKDGNILFWCIDGNLLHRYMQLLSDLSYVSRGVALKWFRPLADTLKNCPSLI